MLDIILSQTVSGLVLGGLYVLIAIGLSIIFGLLGIVNFAHGAFFTLGAYFALTLYQTFGWPAVVLSPIIVGAIGISCEPRLLIADDSSSSPRRRRRVSPSIASLCTAISNPHTRDCAGAASKAAGACGGHRDNGGNRRLAIDSRPGRRRRSGPATAGRGRNTRHTAWRGPARPPG